MDLSPLSSKVHNYQDSLDRTIPFILPSIHKNNRIVIDDQLTISFEEWLVQGERSLSSRAAALIFKAGSPAGRRIINLPVPTTWLVASIVENYSCATGPFNLVHEYGGASTARKSGRYEPPFKTGSLDYRQKSSLPRRSICVVSYMPSYPIFEALMESRHSHRARVSRNVFVWIFISEYRIYIVVFSNFSKVWWNLSMCKAG